MSSIYKGKLGNLPVSKAWSTLSVVDLIVVIRISAGTLSPTAKEEERKIQNRLIEILIAQFQLTL